MTGGPIQRQPDLKDVDSTQLGDDFVEQRYRRRQELWGMKDLHPAFSSF
jgi:hypothetical protein